MNEREEEFCVCTRARAAGECILRGGRVLLGELASLRSVLFLGVWWVRSSSVNAAGAGFGLGWCG